MNKTVILLYLFSAISASALCQNRYTPDSAAQKLYGPGYDKAQFPNGADSLKTYIDKHIVYPDAAKENNIEGRVIVRFLIDEQGTLSHVTVIRGVGGGCDEEAVRIIKGMPHWRAAMYKGRAIKTVMIQPIVFRLD